MKSALPFWQRRNVERYLVPLLTPIVIVVAVAVYVLNLSRIFLSAHGHAAVVVGSVVAVTILTGATILATSSQVRSHTISLVTAAFLLVVVSSGWLVLGHSQERRSSSIVLGATGASQGSITITASPTGGYSFAPARVTLKTGIYLVVLRDGAAASHTLDFDQSSTLWAGLVVNRAGDTKRSRIFFGTPGDYTFFCAIPNHRTYGMQGVVHVTGVPVTLAQAERAASST